jgi:ADP-ribose pyrophosphatase YjhB (NUDIX family)
MNTINKNNQQMIISAALLFRDQRGKRQYLVVKTKEDADWEIPKVIVRKGESSVRASIRMAGEQIGISARVLEEAGRSTGVTVLNGKSVSQKLYYYLMMQRAKGGEVLGFNDFAWLEYDKAYKKLASKKEKEILRGSKPIWKEWEKTKKHKMEEEEAEIALQAAQS